MIVWVFLCWKVWHALQRFLISIAFLIGIFLFKSHLLSIDEANLAIEDFKISDNIVFSFTNLVSCFSWLGLQMCSFLVDSKHLLISFNIWSNFELIIRNGIILTVQIATNYDVTSRKFFS